MNNPIDKGLEETKTTEGKGIKEKYKYSNFEVYINHLKSIQIGKRFNHQAYMRLEIKEAEFGIYNIDLCFDSIDKTIEWFEKRLVNLKKFRGDKL